MVTHSKESKCLIPRFDGAVLSTERKQALWGKFVIGVPRPQTPSKLQYSERKSTVRPPQVRGRRWEVVQLSRKLGMNPTMGPAKSRSTVFSAAKEAVVVAFRRQKLLPLDDCLYAW